MVNLPIRIGNSTTSGFGVAEFDFDPGWQIGEEIAVKDAALSVSRRHNDRFRDDSEPRFSFLGQVVERKHVVSVDTQHEEDIIKDSYTLIVNLEVADKEIIPDMVSKMEPFLKKLEARGDLNKLDF
jgi:hypothetical protein